MKISGRTKGIFRCWLGIVVIGVPLLFFACGQESGKPSDLSKKAPPSFGAISNVDGSEEEKKDLTKPKVGSEQKPEQSPANSQAGQTAPKQ